MHIQRITVQNFRCFEHLEFELNPDINIFVGNNGSGKSAVLDAIAAAIYPYISELQRIGEKEGDHIPFLIPDFSVFSQNNKSKIGTIFFTVLNGLTGWKTTYSQPNTESDIRLNRLSVGHSFSYGKESFDSQLKKRFSLDNNEISNLSVIAYYKGNRNLSNEINFKTITHQSYDRFDSLANCLDAIANFNDVINWFFGREFQELREAKRLGDINYELPDLKQVRNAIKTIIHPNARVYCNQTTSIQLMVEWETETGEKLELSLNQLSAGYRNMLALVMDFARRLAQANPHLENPLEAEAILMIDEIDLHLHPTWQQKIIPDLRKVFPNTQIIATTHSPEVVTTVDRHQVWILENYQIKACPTPTKGMKSSDIVRYVLGLGDLRPDTEESRKLKALFAAIDAGNLEEAKRLQKELEVWQFFDADMTRADMQIRRLERSMPV